MAAHKQRGWQVPGFGLPLQWPRTRPSDNGPHPIGNEDILLRSALDNSADYPYCYTVRELKMLAWINELTDMPDWEFQIFDSEWAFQWKSAKIIAGYDATRSMADWCFQEAKYYAHDFYKTAIIPALDGGVLKSYIGFDEEIRLDLKAAANALRVSTGIQEVEVSIVDPHLFPFAWDKTRVLRKCRVTRTNCIYKSGEGEIVKEPPKEDCPEPDHGRYRNDMAYSNRFQWLPFDVEFEDGTSRIKSYMPNVHPAHHSALYSAIEMLIDRIIPLFNRTIVSLKAPGYINQRIRLIDFAREPIITRDPEDFRPPEQRAEEVFLDESGCFPKSLLVDLKKEFWNVGLQMVLHMRDINLSPSYPEYGGEEWHVQGQLNERICASATYIYSTSNLCPKKPPQISFRSAVSTEEAMAARGAIHTPPFLPAIYGVKHGDPAIQALGSLTLSEGRVITWPNTFQTRLLPFRLDDTTKAGNLRMLTLHLVDPNRPIMSTSLVPNQRRDWWDEGVWAVSSPMEGST